MIAENRLPANTANSNFHFCSSISDDVSHPSSSPNAYEWWYFDAISDDGRDVLTVIFLDNFVFSPRYNAQCAKRKPNGTNSASAGKFPALAFCFYRDGKPLYRAINEFAPDAFSAGSDFPSCRMGESEFQFEATPYGVRYILSINANLRGKRKLVAALEWLVIERDLYPNPNPDMSPDRHFWNLASPRADVTGKITVFDQHQKQSNQIQFRGTGYHDHNQDSRWLPATVAEWQWGRAHFADATAVFYRYREMKDELPTTKVFLVQENKFSIQDAACSVASQRLNVLGVKYPRRLELLTEKDFSLSVKQLKTIDASFFYLRFLSEMKLDLGDGKTHETIGITEHLAPRSLRWRSLDWLVNMRIGRNGRGAFLP